MDVINPTTGDVITTYERDDEENISEALTEAEDRFKSWKCRSLQHREDLCSNVGDVLRDDKERFAELMTREMGKPIEQARSEVEKCSWLCDHYAENAGRYLQDDVHPSPSGTNVRTVYEPLGTILAVMPWNFPFWQVFRFAIPYLTVGNVGILKHASSVPGCATAIEEIFSEAGYPEGTFQSLLVGSQSVDALISDDRIRGTTLTGSGPAGSAVAESSGREIKRSVLELGGSDPYVVLDDADVSKSAETGVMARNQNNGQSCIAAKRFIVVESVYDEFLENLKSGFEDLNIGHPMEEDTDIGPLSSKKMLNNVQRQVEESIDDGAKLELGGTVMNKDGFYYPPTILSEIPRGCPVDKEEVFGPVASVYKVQDEQEAVSKANDTDFGLGASIWTKDVSRGKEIATNIRAGCVYVNEMVKSDPRVPFGGVGKSGYGRELSEIGIKEFTNRKTIWIDDTKHEKK